MNLSEEVVSLLKISQEFKTDIKLARTQDELSQDTLDLLVTSKRRHGG